MLSAVVQRRQPVEIRLVHVHAILHNQHTNQCHGFQTVVLTRSNLPKKNTFSWILCTNASWGLVSDNHGTPEEDLEQFCLFGGIQEDNQEEKWCFEKEMGLSKNDQNLEPLRKFLKVLMFVQCLYQVVKFSKVTPQKFRFGLAWSWKRFVVECKPFLGVHSRMNCIQLI